MAGSVALTTRLQSYHATNVQGATVELDFVGTGVRIFSATVPTPGSYEVYVDGERLSEGVGSSSGSDSQLLGSITGLEMAPHTITLVNSGMTGDILDLDRVQVENVLFAGRCGTSSLHCTTAHRTGHSARHCLPQLSTTPLTRSSGDLDGFLPEDSQLFMTTPSSTYTL